MSATNEPLPSTTPTPPAPTKGSSWKYTLVLVVLLLAGTGAWYAYFSSTAMPIPPDELQSLKTYITNLAKTQKLADTYTDENGDLVADPPKDPAKLLQVNEIVFSAVGGDDPDKAQEKWASLMKLLHDRTGKTVTYSTDATSVQEQVRLLGEGKLHVTAFNTGQVATAVNTAGFVPMFCPADANGTFAYQMEILVPANSSAQKPEDLKGKTVGLVGLSSNSGGKAPLVIFKDKFGMLPGRDYKYTFTGAHDMAVKGVATGQYDAVCVANDLIAGATAKWNVKPEQLRSIYKSESFPVLCFGVPNNLPPDLTAKVKQSFTDFSFATISPKYQTPGQVKFAPVDYKTDWKLIREVDDSLSHLLDTK